jgi:Ca2+-binding EF-hand superfamily protein
LSNGSAYPSHYLCTGKNAVDFAEFMKMMSKNGTDTGREVKETFGLFNKSGRSVCL